MFHDVPFMEQWIEYQIWKVPGFQAQVKHVPAPNWSMPAADPHNIALRQCVPLAQAVETAVKDAASRPWGNPFKNLARV